MSASENVKPKSGTDNLPACTISKLIGKYETKIVYIYDQAFKVGVVGNLVSTLDVGF